jgi:hypothetical protein
MNGRWMLVVSCAGLIAAGYGCTVKKATGGSSSSATSGAGASSGATTQQSTSPSSTTTSTSTGGNPTSTGTTTATGTSSSTGSGGNFVANCNPVTNAPCTTGQACDASNQGTFECFDPPNDAKLCGACDNSAGPFCGGGMGCAQKKCAKYCCDDGDCGTGGKCTKSDQNGPFWPGVDVGICLDANMMSACMAPAMSPSMGKCVTVK